jgi:hypothetical protein
MTPSLTRMRPGKTDRAVGRTLLCAGVCLLAVPARAELQVQVSRTQTGRYEPVGITVHDPLGGLDVKPGALSVTMADSRDHRQSFFLEPTGRAGQWSGRFTPLRAGRYTGTAVLERGDETEIGLVPLIRVGRSQSRGFLRLRPASPRAFTFTGGGTLFPVGVRLAEAELASPVNWRAELDRLRAGGINYIELPVPWTGAVSSAERADALQRTEILLNHAEHSPGLAVQLRFEPPPDFSDDSVRLYESRLQQWVRRWSYSPAVAVWYLAGASRDLSAETRARLVRAVRGADSYGHLVGIPYGPDMAGADLFVASSEAGMGLTAPVLMEAPPDGIEAASMAGAASWRMLARGGIGLPLWSYSPAKSAGMLHQASRLAAVAREIPFHAVPAPAPALSTSGDTATSFCRYGTTLVGWISGARDGSTALPPLLKGSYRMTFWNPAAAARTASQVIWSGGPETTVRIPPGAQSLFVHVAPAEASTGATGAAARPAVRRAAPSRRTQRRVTPRRLSRGRLAAKKPRRSRGSSVRQPRTKREARARGRHTGRRRSRR